MENMNILDFSYGERLQSQGDMNISIATLIQWLENGIIQIPKHQRDFVWNEQKQKEYVNNIFQMEFLPVGVIVTYQLRLKNGCGSVKYLNDGFQRTTTLRRLKSNPDQYGRSKKEVEELINNMQIPMQHRWYDSHETAAIQFQYLNIGTAMAPYDFHKQDLVYLDNYEQYEETINRVIKATHDCDASLCKTILKDSEGYKKGIRDVYANIYRYLSKQDSTTAEYRSVANTKVGERSFKYKPIEIGLKKELEKVAIKEFEGQCNVLINMLYDTKALVESSFNEANALIEKRNNIVGFGQTNKIQNNTINFRVWRWILCSIIQLKLYKVSIPNIKEIILEILAITGGQNISSIIYENKTINTFITFQNPVSLFLMIEDIGKGHLLKELKRRKQNTSNIKNGYDISHVKPFSKYGEGETFIEPSSLNRSRGNREPVLI